MSSNTETFTFDRPETIDDATYSRIVFIRPLELAGGLSPRFLGGST